MKWKDLFQSFLQGLVTPSWVSGVVMLLTVSGVLLTVTVTVTPTFLSRHGFTALRTSPNDDYAHLIQELMCFRVEGLPRDTVHVFVLGNSADREQIYSEGFLASRIEERIGRPVQAHVLATAGQSVATSAVIMDLLPLPPESVVVVGLKLHRITQRDKNQSNQLGLRVRSGGLRERHHGWLNRPMTGNWALDNIEFLLPRMGILYRHFLLPPEGGQYDMHHFRPGNKISEGKMLKDQEKLETRAAKFSEKAMLRSLAPLGQVMERIRSQGGISVVVLETLLSPRYKSEIMGPDKLRRSREMVAAFAGDHGALYWDLDPEMDVSEADFHDWRHVNQPTLRARYTELLAQRIAALLPERE